MHENFESTNKQQQHESQDNLRQSEPQGDQKKMGLSNRGFTPNLSSIPRDDELIEKSSLGEITRQVNELIMKSPLVAPRRSTNEYQS